MCLAIPGKIVSIDNNMAIIDYGGVKKKASLMVLPDAVIGDMVIVHAGFAISKISAEDAKKTLETFEMLNKAKAKEISQTSEKADK